MDVLITYYGLSLGGIELSPLGFNVISLTFNAFLIAFLGVMIYINNDIFIDSIIFIGVFIWISILVVANINNLFEVYNYLNAV